MENGIVFNYDNAVTQVAALLDLHPHLKVTYSTQLQIVLAGDVTVHRTYKDFPILRTYSLEITIPIGTNDLPYVKDIGNHIDENYPHRYSDGILCLATDTEIKIRYLDGFDLGAWMRDFVQPYYYSYEYYQRYAYFPFGDRSHGHLGTLQTYVDILGAKEIDIAYRIIKGILSTKEYRGHLLCLCGSGNIMRGCHGARILQFFKDTRLMDILKTDDNLIKEEIKYFNEQNRRKTKRTRSI